MIDEMDNFINEGCLNYLARLAWRRAICCYMLTIVQTSSWTWDTQYVSRDRIHVGPVE